MALAPIQLEWKRAKLTLCETRTGGEVAARRGSSDRLLNWTQRTLLRGLARVFYVCEGHEILGWINKRMMVQGYAALVIPARKYRKVGVQPCEMCY